jgi:drug/metabolite transporter superfamily protein YnfA
VIFTPAATAAPAPSAMPAPNARHASAALIAATVAADSWWIDGVKPDCYDIAGGLVALVGVAILMYAPRQ